MPRRLPRVRRRSRCCTTTRSGRSTCRRATTRSACWIRRRSSCAEASDLFRQFLEDFDGRLSRPWVVDPQAAAFTRGAGGSVGFTVSPAGSGGGGGGGGHHPVGAICPGTFQVLHDDHIGSFAVPSGHYLITLLSVGRITCSARRPIWRASSTTTTGSSPGRGSSIPRPGRSCAALATSASASRSWPARRVRTAAAAAPSERQALPGHFPRAQQRQHRPFAPAQGLLPDNAGKPGGCPARARRSSSEASFRTSMARSRAPGGWRCRPPLHPWSQSQRGIPGEADPLGSATARPAGHTLGHGMTPTRTNPPPSASRARLPPPSGCARPTSRWSCAATTGRRSICSSPSCSRWSRTWSRIRLVRGWFRRRSASWARRPLGSCSAPTRRPTTSPPARVRRRTRAWRARSARPRSCGGTPTSTPSR